MKISVIGAGNVGGLTAMRIAQDGLGDIVLFDIAKGLAMAKAFDLEDSRAILKYDYKIKGSENIEEIKDSDIVVITAGLTRKPGMSREELLSKNAELMRDICLKIKEIASNAIVIVVTNPLDIMTYLALKITGFSRFKVFGMGISLDSARFSNLVSQELNIPSCDIDASVIASHGEMMLPLTKFTKIKGVSLDEFLDQKRIENIIKRTIDRGLQIVSLLGAGSAYFAPSAAISAIVRCVVKDEKRALGVSVCLNGEYGIKDICIGVPCRLGRNGIEQIIELALNQEEKEKLNASAQSIQELIKKLP